MQGMQRRLQPRRCTFTAFTEEEEEDAPSFSLPPFFLLPSSPPATFRAAPPPTPPLRRRPRRRRGRRRRRPRRLSSSSSFYLQCHSSGRKCMQLFEKGECTYAAAAATKLLPTSFPPFPSLPFPRPSCGCGDGARCTVPVALGVVWPGLGFGWLPHLPAVVLTPWNPSPEFQFHFCSRVLVMWLNCC